MATKSGKMVVCSLRDFATECVPCSEMDGADPEEVGYPPYFEGCTCVVVPCRKTFKDSGVEKQFLIHESLGMDWYGDTYLDYE